MCQEGSQACDTTKPLPNACCSRGATPSLRCRPKGRAGWEAVAKVTLRSASIITCTERPGRVTSEVQGFAARPPHPGRKRERGGHRESRASCFSLTSRCTSCRRSPWLALLRSFNFLSLSLNNQSRQFPVPQPQPPPTTEESGLKLHLNPIN